MFSFRMVLVAIVGLALLFSAASWAGHELGQYTAEYAADVMEGMQR